ncbi:hypothetical protein [Streptomyces virginiae]|uniref:hypothetical protein n=1 Tax=Streptomyces virginiae TaxID=1961 RepID=UPI0036B57114
MRFWRWTNQPTLRRRVRCSIGTSDHHDEGELDERVVGFYEQLRSLFPDRPPFAAESPWMSTPLTIGIDPVIMNLSFSSRSDAAIKAIEELVSGVPPGHLGSAVPGRTSAGA